MNEARCRSRLLQLACLLSGGTALLSLLVAVTSDHWLTTTEPVAMPTPSTLSTYGPENGEVISADFTPDYTADNTPDPDPYADLDDDNVGGDMEGIDLPTMPPFFRINTFSGLWRICLLTAGEGLYWRTAWACVHDM